MICKSQTADVRAAPGHTHEGEMRRKTETRHCIQLPFTVGFYLCLPVPQPTLKPMLCLICVSHSLLGVTDLPPSLDSSYWQPLRMAVAITTSAQIVLLHDITGFMVLNAGGVEA